MKIFLGVVALVVLFIVWRVYATAAGSRKAYKTLLAEIAPITEALGAGRDPEAADLVAFAGNRANEHYFVFRFRMKPPHWAAAKGWQAGVAGPYDLTGDPMPSGRNTFSRFESFESRTPEQHVEAIHDPASKRGR